MLRGLGSVVIRVHGVTVCRVSVMRAFLVIAVLVMLGCCSMMPSRVFVMLRGLVMMVDVFGHGILSDWVK